MKASGLPGTNLTMILIMCTIVFLVMFWLTTTNDRERAAVTLTRNAYLLTNALDYGKIVAETSLTYSFYQGCWEVLRDGGGIAVWYDNTEKTPTEEMYKTQLSERTRGFFQKYLSSPYTYLNGIQPTFPQDYLITFASEPSFSLLANAYSPTTTISVTSTKPDQILRLSLPATIQKTYTGSCLELFVKERLDGKTLGKGIEQAVYGVTNSLPKAGTVTVDGTIGGTNEDLATLYFKETGGKTLQETEQDISAKIRKATEGVKLTSDFAVSQEFTQFDVRVQPTCTAQVTQVNDVVKTVISCSFVYQVTLEQKVTITDKREERKWPVFNGQDVAMESPQLVFQVRIDKAIDKDIPLFDATGTYHMTFLFTGTYTHVTAPIALLQDGSELDWSVPLGSGTLSGTGSITGEDFSLTGVPLQVTDTAGLLHLASVDVTGTLTGGTFTAQIADTRERLSGTYQMESAPTTA